MLYENQMMWENRISIYQYQKVSGLQECVLSTGRRRGGGNKQLVRTLFSFQVSSLTPTVMQIVPHLNCYCKGQMFAQ